MAKENIMRQLKIEKVVLNVGGTGEDLERGIRLLKLLTGRNPSRSVARKRIPTLGVRPGLEIGAMVTIRKEPEVLLKKMLVAIDNDVDERPC